MSTLSRLTSHQREVMNEIRRRYARLQAIRSRDWGVAVEHVGSRGAIQHLAQKGYVELHEGEPGPRGGVRLFVRPVESERA